MKKLIELPENKNVVFEPDGHVYTMGDKQLSGITSIIHKYLFPDMYSNVNEAILERARERGSAIHEELQLEFAGLSAAEPSVEVLAYRKLAKANSVQQIASEYLVSDNDRIATCIDAVWQISEDEVVLADYKTTSVLQHEYLSWQLSVEAFLFEAQTGLTVSRLVAVHLPKPKDGVCDASFTDVTRLPNEYVIALIDAYKSGAESFTNPLHVLSDDFNEMLEQYAKAEEALLDLEASVAFYKNMQADIKARLKEHMDAAGATKWENADKSICISRAKDTVRRTFKIDLLKEHATQTIRKWLDKNLDKCYAETVVAGNISVKFK